MPTQQEKLRRHLDLVERELKLRAAAGVVMKELRERGDDWQAAWRDHPIAKEYRALLREAWAVPGGPDAR